MYLAVKSYILKWTSVSPWKRALSTANNGQSLYTYFILCHVFFAQFFYFSYLVPLDKDTYLSKTSLCECALISSIYMLQGHSFLVDVPDVRVYTCS